MGMSKDAPQLPDDIQACHELLRAQGETIAALQQQVAKLEFYVERLVRQRFGPRSEKIDPNQLSLFEDGGSSDEEAHPTDEEPDDPEIEVSAHKRRGGGRNKLPDDLPRERVEHDLAEEEKPCPCCGEIRQRIGEETSEQLEFVPASLKVIEHVRFKYACRACQEHVVIADAPSKPIAKGLAGPGLLATIVVGKYSDHLPLYRHEEIFARHGVEISRGTMCRWVRETADLLRPLYELMISRVLQSRCLHTDDTTVPVQDKALPKTRTGRFWAYCGDADHPYSVYEFTPSRERDGPAKFLADYEGFLHADAFSGYDHLYEGARIQQVLCWAHARRKFFEARTVQPIPAHSAMTAIKYLYAVETEAKSLAQGLDLSQHDQREAWYQQRYGLRQRKSIPVLEEFQGWLGRTQLQVLPKSPVGQAIGYILPRWSGFTRYCTDGRLSIDNNLSERTLRPCAIGRKNYLFVGNDRGGASAAVHYTMMASCKANGVEPFAYLRDVFEQLPAVVEKSTVNSSSSKLASDPLRESLEQFLPDVWLRSHPHSRRLAR